MKQSGAGIVGVGVIKPDRPSYTKKVAKQSGAKLHREMRELGYVTVMKEHRGRGISRAIVQVLLSAHETPLFATTSVARMKSTLEQFGFVQQGKEWTGRGGELSLWVKE